MKKFLIIILVLLILLLGAAWAYLLLYGRPQSLSEVGDALLGRTKQAPIVVTERPESPTPPQEDTPRILPVDMVLGKISSRAVAGAGFANSGSSDVIRYMEKGTGHIYDITLSDGAETVVSDETLPYVVEALWSPAGTRALLTLEIDGTYADTYLGTLTTAEDGSTTLTTESLYGIAHPAFIRGGAALYYTERTDSGTRGVLYDLKARTRTTVFTLPLREITMLWDIWNERDHYLYTKPALGFEGFLYRIEKGELIKMDSAFHLTALRTDADTVIANKNSGSGPYSLMQTYENGTGRFLSLQTLSEKCAGGGDWIWCAASSAMNASDFPIAWYQGLVSYADNLYRINRATGEVVLAADLSRLSREQIDATDFLLHTDRALFRNKRDDSLWLYNITAAETE